MDSPILGLMSQADIIEVMPHLESQYLEVDEHEEMLSTTQPISIKRKYIF